MCWGGGGGGGVGIPALYCLVVAQILVNKAGRADPWGGLKGVATPTMGN